MNFIKGTLKLGFLLILCACNNVNKTNGTDVSEIAQSTTKKSSTTDYVQRLYQYYVENPTNQSHIDENIIIDYLIDKDMVMDRDPLGYYYTIESSHQASDPYKHADDVTAHYEGSFLDGRIFDSSYERGTPIKFKVGQMIPAWNEVLKKMSKGDKVSLITPSRLAYQERGFPGYVAPNTVLKFSIEVL